jgi:hypothetical protein
MKIWTPEEQKANRAKLSAALRSGEYTQAELRLKTPTGYCCLGVACDLALKEGGIIDNFQWATEISDDGRPCYLLKHKTLDENGKPIASFSVAMPELVRRWLGLETDLGGYGYVYNKTKSLEYESGSLKFER